MIEPLTKIQYEQRAWEHRNFPDSNANDNLIGMMEELGELSHSFLKMKQGIRGEKSEHLIKIKDAVGDLTIFMMAFCSKLGIDFGEAVEDTWEEVRLRNWLENKNDGS